MNQSRRDVLELSRKPIACIPDYPEFVIYPRHLPEELRDLTRVPMGHIAFVGTEDRLSTTPFNDTLEVA